MEIAFGILIFSLVPIIGLIICDLYENIAALKKEIMILKEEKEKWIKD